MTNLCDMKCKACKGETQPLSNDEIHKLKAQLHNEWKILSDETLHREFRFKDFAQALEFANQVGNIAETQQHHPDLYISWGLVVVELFTHAVDGLTENDFILAAQIDRIEQ